MAALRCINVLAGCGCGTGLSEKRCVKRSFRGLRGMADVRCVPVVSATCPRRPCVPISGTVCTDKEEYFSEKPPTPLLDTMHNPFQMKDLTIRELRQLADELQSETIFMASNADGHGGCSLGMVELTVALHHIFHKPGDKILWDVGRQACLHKILTERRNRRKSNGLSDLTKLSEYEYDAVHVGFCSSTSANLVGQDAKGKNHAITIIEDGAAIARQASEAMNDAQYMDSNVILILNDNKQGITKQVGESVFQWAAKVNEYAGMGSRSLSEELGLSYIGPVDGHSIDDLVTVFQEVVHTTSPVLIHVVTEKGQCGYSYADGDVDKHQGVVKFDPATGKQVKDKAVTQASHTCYDKAWSATQGSCSFYDNAWIAKAKTDKRVTHTALGGGPGGLNSMSSIVFLERCLDVSMVEQAFAAGFDHDGLKPSGTLYSSCLQEASHQIPVRFTLDQTGLAAADGPAVLEVRYLLSTDVAGSSHEAQLFHTVATQAKHDDHKCSFFQMGGSGIGIPLPIGNKDTLLEKCFCARLSHESTTQGSPSSAERLDLSLSHRQLVSASRGASRTDGDSALTNFDSLDQLHQQLDFHDRSSSSLIKPLGIDGANKLREKLKEHKKKNMQSIQHSMLRRGDNGGDEISCSVDPDSLVIGEYVVHKKVGVGKFMGIKYEVPAGKNKEVKYIYLKYADGVAKLKANQAYRLLYRYYLPGETDRGTALSKLKDTSSWEKRKSKGKIAVQKMVVNMMEVYILRLRQSRPTHIRNEAAIVKFAASFPYEPTPDQLQAFADVERDMTQRDVPMDRLICGDVGFGKTEVALRAIVIAVTSGKQVMVLTPTTVLAKQHFEICRDRFSTDSRFKIALLSRFQNKSEKKELVMGIRDGTYNVVIGTHSLLGSQIQYHNLGLLVVDEEQRFGVKQKERIMGLKTTVDVLTLSATPIPRTLYLALMGFRDASLLTTPPPERRPIRTHLLEYSEKMARQAIRFELDRGGQIFYVVPRVRGIEEFLLTLQSRFPDVKVAVAHGQQSPSVLEDAMEKFSEGETRILLCTNIIESGLDIRRVNTIIVEDVHLFGLAQLYQLRGRVGRADREAHAYMFYPSKDLLTDEALERLVALEDCCELGQGFHLAERDMAIRGVGSLFGEQQSGDAAKIGIDLYFEMLLEGLSKVDSHYLPPVKYDDVQVELEVDAYIPVEYIQQAEGREKVLKKLQVAASESLRALVVFTNWLRDRFGKEPPSTEMLLKMLYIKRMAADLGIHRIRVQGTSVLMETEMNLEAFEMISSSITSESLRSSLAFEDGCIQLQCVIGLPQERQMERIFCCLSDMLNSLPSFVKYR